MALPFSRFRESDRQFCPIPGTCKVINSLDLDRPIQKALRFMAQWNDRQLFSIEWGSRSPRAAFGEKVARECANGRVLEGALAAGDAFID
jgi:hypothetical protein